MEEERASLEEMYEEQVRNDFEELSSMDLDDEDRKALVSEIAVLTEKLKDLKSVQFDYWDKHEKREMEERKNNAMIEIEQAKVKTDWKKVLLDAVKIGTPILVGIISVSGHLIEQEKEHKFERDGEVHTSWWSRKMNPPKM